MALEIVPCSIQDAKAYVDQYHRHHRPPTSGLFAVAVADVSRNPVSVEHICGVAVIGRPSSKGFQDGWTAEVPVLRQWTKACSMLYGACWRPRVLWAQTESPSVGGRGRNIAAARGLAAEVGPKLMALVELPFPAARGRAPVTG
jgi:hypothetical protein